MLNESQTADENPTRRRRLLPTIVSVIVSAKQWKSYDYLPPDPPVDLEAGMRVKVPFGRSTRVGVIIGFKDRSELAVTRLKKIQSVLDERSLVPDDMLSILLWAADYYHYPLGEVVLGVFPPSLRRGEPVSPPVTENWFLRQCPDPFPERAPKQMALIEFLQTHKDGASADALKAFMPQWRSIMAKLEQKGWVTVKQQSRRWLDTAVQNESKTPPELNAYQKKAVQAIDTVHDEFVCYLLDGVTGSGKTEVYLSAMKPVLERGGQCLILVPEIGLTPQTVRRFQSRFPYPVAVLHSNLNSKERTRAWLAAESGEARIIIGTRSAVFVPCPDLALIVVDEEHDASFKQQEGFRYHARDLAVMRANQLKIPIVMGSATPSLESIYNTQLGRYRRLSLPTRAGDAVPPMVKIYDVRGQPIREGVSVQLVNRMREYLDQNAQVLLFLNRRGYAPVLLCHQCGWVSRCVYCDANMVYHAGAGRLRCHHCGVEKIAETQCPKCRHPELYPMGYGTQRVEQYIQEVFPDVDVVRIDRDSTRRKGALDQALAKVKKGERQILIGTQMLAKGHHFPNLQLVALLDADQGLFSQDFRAPERLAQLVVQVAGRAGRGDKAGEVIIQTHAPQHPLLVSLVRYGYQAFTEAALKERETAGWPPHSYLALLRAEAPSDNELYDFLNKAKLVAGNKNNVTVMGPVPAPMEKRAGKWRGQVLVQAQRRSMLQAFLDHWMPQLIQLPAGKQLRWSIDVDPIDLY